ncbi:glycosyltransferase involved in cell wall biosynthesis [Propionicimonas paludicola]|uniref:Glycosyltransferase involved in cell wall biosynthesis n=1 Tax=Propionicimonas paludicola TaxID=185243 RepID=A0A2A9CSP0_9ACTN|nr:glycosyltransferase family 4 protein [Propionicimonas paludicola]PFG17463.1 glycosyltransferase involved in cell wall biosynthesis [Propionicimonas paludicola]
MRVVFVLPGYATSPVGGYAIVHQYANYLSAINGVEVHIYYDQLRLSYPGKQLSTVAIKHAIHSAYRALGRTGLARFRPWESLDQRVQCHGSLAHLRRLRLSPADVLIATAVETAEFVTDAARRTGCSGWYFLQAIEDWGVGEPYLKQTMRLPLRKIAVAPWIRDYCLDVGEPCELVMNAVDADGFPLGEFGPARSYACALLSPGIPRKRTDVAIQVLNRLAEAQVPAMAFGTCDRPAELDERVLFHQNPSRELLVSIYQRSRVFFCVSEQEGFGLTPVEATLCGSAVVSTNNGGVDSYGQSFVVFTGTPDVEVTVDAVRTLMDDPEAARLRALQGRAELQAYTPQRAAESFTDLILGR